MSRHSFKLLLVGILLMLTSVVSKAQILSYADIIDESIRLETNRSLLFSELPDACDSLKRTMSLFLVEGKNAQDSLDWNSIGSLMSRCPQDTNFVSAVTALKDAYLVSGTNDISADSLVSLSLIYFTDLGDIDGQIACHRLLLGASSYGELGSQQQVEITLYRLKRLRELLPQARTTQIELFSTMLYFDEYDLGLIQPKRSTVDSLYDHFSKTYEPGAVGYSIFFESSTAFAAVYYYEFGRPDISIDILSKSEAYISPTSQNYMLYLMNMGAFHSAANMDSTALGYYLMAKSLLDSYEEGTWLYYQYLFDLSIARVYSRIGDIDSTSKYFNLALSKLSEYAEEEITSNRAALEAELDLKLKGTQIDHLTALDEAKSANIRNLAIVMMVLAISVAFAIGLYIRNRKITRETRKNIEFRENIVDIVTHDFKGPIMQFLNVSALISDQLVRKDYEAAQDYAQILDQSALTIHMSLENLLIWSRGRHLNGDSSLTSRSNPVQILESSVSLYYFMIEERNLTVDIDVSLEDRAKDHGVSSFASIAIRNSIYNAIKHAVAQSEIKVKSSFSENTWELIIQNEASPEKVDKLISIMEDIMQGNEDYSDTNNGLHFGLRLIKSCLDEIGGEMSVTTIESSKIQTTLSFPIV